MPEKCCGDAGGGHKSYHGNKWMPVLHAHYYGILTDVAREQGYALALHGTLVRDLDLIAVAWTVDAKSPDELIKALRDALGTQGYDTAAEKAEQKPHGRLGYVILTGGGAYIDISIIPPCRSFRPFPGGTKP